MLCIHFVLLCPKLLVKFECSIFTGCRNNRGVVKLQIWSRSPDHVHFGDIPKYFSRCYGEAVFKIWWRTVQNWAHSLVRRRRMLDGWTSDGRIDSRHAKMNLYSVHCHTLHWTVKSCWVYISSVRMMLWLETCIKLRRSLFHHYKIQLHHHAVSRVLLTMSFCKLSSFNINFTYFQNATDLIVIKFGFWAYLMDTVNCAKFHFNTLRGFDFVVEGRNFVLWSALQWVAKWKPIQDQVVQIGNLIFTEFLGFRTP